MKKTLAFGILLSLILLLTITCVSATWYDTDFSYRKQIDVSHVNASGETITNYPAFINVTKEAVMQSDFDDIRFVDNSDNLMAFEFENHTASYGLYWVNITSLLNTGQIFWMYYGNDTVSSATNPTAVWETNAKMVQHMKDLTTSTIEDSTANNNDGNKKAVNEPIEVGGKIAKAQEFDGVDDYVDCSNDPSLNITEEITIEAWIYPVSGTGYIISKNTASAGDNQYAIYWAGNKVTYYPDSHPSSAINSVLTGQWTHVVFTRTGTTGQFYINGTASGGAENCNMSTKNVTVNIGRRKPDNFYFNGTIDEVRIYNRALSTDEINQNYQLMSNQSSFVTWGSAEGYWVSVPTNLQNTYNNFWVNWTWEAGSGGGLETDSYNVSWLNDTISSWQNSTITYLNHTTAPHDWVNVSVWAYNATQAKLSESSADEQQQIPNNAPTITNCNDWSGTGIVNEIVELDFGYTDLDGDVCTFSTNASKGSLDTGTGIFIWQTEVGDDGEYSWKFNATDGYGLTDSCIVTILLGDIALNRLIDTTETTYALLGILGIVFLVSLILIVLFSMYNGEEINFTAILTGFVMLLGFFILLYIMLPLFDSLINVMGG